MKSKIELLDDKTHKNLLVDFADARASSRQQRVIPVVTSEFHTLMFHYPIVFVKDGETGEFTCSVLLGVSGEASLLDGKDLSHDEGLPLNVCRLPLVAIRSDGAEPVVGINTDARGVGKGERLFGKSSPGLDSAVAALGELYRGYTDTRNYVKTVLELGLVNKLLAEIQFKNKPKMALEGLYGIDPERISQISDNDKGKFLSIASFAYAQSFSLYNMKRLTHLSA